MERVGLFSPRCGRGRNALCLYVSIFRSIFMTINPTFMTKILMVVKIILNLHWLTFLFFPHRNLTVVAHGPRPHGSAYRRPYGASGFGHSYPVPSAPPSAAQSLQYAALFPVQPDTDAAYTGTWSTHTYCDVTLIPANISDISVTLFNFKIIIIMITPNILHLFIILHLWWVLVIWFI